MSQRAAAPSGDWIPYAIIGFFVSFVVLLSGFAWIAFHTYTGEVTKDAYKKGLAYNNIIKESESQLWLGWKALLDVQAQGRTVEVSFLLKDADGHLLNKAEVYARFSRPTQAGHDRSIVLKPDAKGLYHGKTELDWLGVWDVRVSATFEGRNFQQSKTITLK